MRGTDPRAILKDLLPETVLPPDLDDMTLWQIIINISEPPKRKKRKDVNTLEDVVRLLSERKKILVLTGAGVCLGFLLSDALLSTCPVCPISMVCSCSSSGVCFLWDSWLSVERRHIRSTRGGLSWSSWSSSHVWHRLLQKRSKAFFQICQGSTHCLLIWFQQRMENYFCNYTYLNNASHYRQTHSFNALVYFASIVDRKNAKHNFKCLFYCTLSCVPVAQW